MERAASKLGTGTIIVAVLILAWEVIVHVLEIWSSAFPAPSRVLLEIWRNASQLHRHAIATGNASLTGLLLAIITAAPMAALVFRSLRARHFLTPVISFMQKIPLLAFGPLAVIWLGYGFPPAAAISALVCFPPFFTHLRAGFDSVPVEVVEIFQTMGAPPTKILTKVHLPACLPWAVSAVKIAIPLALAGATVTEFVGSDTGLGYLMFNAGSKADATMLFAALTVLVLMALAAHVIISFIERQWITWPPMVPGRSDSVVHGRLRDTSRDRSV
jgi:ABC-type nitrate/sulfonate/bicarbonate transport system permease component